LANSKIVKLRWANKLAQAKFFVILTDKEAVIALDGVNPDSFEDTLALQTQSAEIEDFIEKLQELKAEHDKKLEELQGGKSATAPRTKAKKVRKIPVRQG
jgi:hypothetical protein